MKHKFFFFLFTIFTICIILFSACKKETKVDYRDKWVGEYECQYVADDSRWNYSSTMEISPIGDDLAYIQEFRYITPTYGFCDTLKVNRDGSFTFLHVFLAPTDGGNFYQDSIVIHVNRGSYYGKKIKKDQLWKRDQYY